MKTSYHASPCPFLPRRRAVHVPPWGTGAGRCRPRRRSRGRQQRRLFLGTRMGSADGFASWRRLAAADPGPAGRWLRRQAARQRPAHHPSLGCASHPPPLPTCPRDRAMSLGMQLTHIVRTVGLAHGRTWWRCTARGGNKCTATPRPAWRPPLPCRRKAADRVRLPRQQRPRAPLPGKLYAEQPHGHAEGAGRSRR